MCEPMNPAPPVKSTFTDSPYLVYDIVTKLALGVPTESNSYDGAMTTRAELRTEKPRRPLLRSLRFWIPVTLLLLLLVLALAGILVGKPVYDRAMLVQSSLEQAMPLASTAKDQILAGDTDGAKATAATLASHTADARKQASDRSWVSLEWIPFIGPNLHAVRTAAIVTDDLVKGAISPATDLSLNALTPIDGAIDLGAVSALQSTIAQAADTTNKAAEDLDAIDKSVLVPQVETAVTKLTTAVDGLLPLLRPANEILSVLPAALGADGPRNYLLMFQGNSEARSLGGNAAAFVVMSVQNGRPSILQHVSSIDFKQGLPEPVAPLDPAAVAIYGDKIGRFTPDLTMVPDFPAATQILKGWWTNQELPAFDGVISLDPVALGYLLAATGPVVLPTGEQLTSDNAVSLLLNEVYFRYTDPWMQDAFFASAADAIFSKITTGAFTPSEFIASLTRAADEGRLLYQSNDVRETELMSSARLSGTMPTDSSKDTVVGVYVNDNTGSKKSYYINMAISLCRAETTVRGTVTLNSTLTADQATNLPSYIAGPYFAPGDISTYLVLYGPPGSTIADVALDGAPASILASGEHLGRPAVKVEVLNHGADAHSVSFTLDGIVADSGPLMAWHTPMTRDTEVTISPSCEQ